MDNTTTAVGRKIANSWEAHIFGVLALLIGSNAYFVQRVISQLDATTNQMYLLREEVGKIEARLEDFNKGKWKQSH